VHQKNAAALALTAVKNEDQREFAKLVDSFKSQFNEGSRVQVGRERCLGCMGEGGLDSQSDVSSSGDVWLGVCLCMCRREGGICVGRCGVGRGLHEASLRRVCGGWCHSLLVLEMQWVCCFADSGVGKRLVAARLGDCPRACGADFV